jgi:hypothetical protein
MFSVVFVFQKSYTWNILEIGRNEALSSYFSRHERESKAETEEGQEAATPPGGAPPLAMPGCGVGPLATLWHRPSAYKIPLTQKP